MLIFKTKDFAQWAKKMNISNKKLAEAIIEIEKGLIDAKLGNFLYKKRIALPHSGKRGGGRTLIAYKANDKAYFIYGFAKNEKENLSEKEQEALKKYAGTLVNMDLKQLNNAMIGGEIIEVNHE